MQTTCIQVGRRNIILPIMRVRIPGTNAQIINEDILGYISTPGETNKVHYFPMSSYSKMHNALSVNEIRGLMNFFHDPKKTLIPRKFRMPLYELKLERLRMPFYGRSYNDDFNFYKSYFEGDMIAHTLNPPVGIRSCTLTSFESFDPIYRYKWVLTDIPSSVEITLPDGEKREINPRIEHTLKFVLSVPPVKIGDNGNFETDGHGNLIKLYDADVDIRRRTVAITPVSSDAVEAYQLVPEEKTSQSVCTKIFYQTVNTQPVRVSLADNGFVGLARVDSLGTGAANATKLDWTLYSPRANLKAALRSVAMSRASYLEQHRKHLPEFAHPRYNKPFRYHSARIYAELARD